MLLHVCVFTDVAGHHDGEQRFVVWVEGDVEGGRLDHDEDGMKDWTTATQENHWKHWFFNIEYHNSKSQWTHTLTEYQTKRQKPSCGFWY